MWPFQSLQIITVPALGVLRRKVPNRRRCLGLRHCRSTRFSISRRGLGPYIIHSFRSRLLYTGVRNFRHVCRCHFRVHLFHRRKARCLIHAGFFPTLGQAVKLPPHHLSWQFLAANSVFRARARLSHTRRETRRERLSTGSSATHALTALPFYPLTCQSSQSPPSMIPPSHQSVGKDLVLTTPNVSHCSHDSHAPLGRTTHANPQSCDRIFPNLRT